ncbi:restriction endonuclease subunit S [Capnocytophaga sputigena]|uniref:restriction endonuclease subunit S n=1 Tax=Capnocytophaga sputigena TaxID=1019 RepID=UPI0028D5F99F|nr:restriction endonuclease subunit S [Capnocytophaga sputigena]
MKTYKKLKLIELKEFDLWDIKRYTSKKLKSTFNIEKLSNCIKEENRKYKLYLEEDKTFGILGVNNKDGIFDAYEQKGKEINQPYKKMEIGWLAYNPYRINVGSIGIRKKEHLYQYISPAYVVFSCLDNLLPEYLYLLFRTERFIKIINESTTGSVRQNLTSEILKTLEIPLPSISEQETIVKNYYDKITQATTYEQQAETLEKNIENYLFESLGIEQKTEEKTKKKGLQFVEFYKMDFWGVDKIKLDKGLHSLRYEVTSIGDFPELLVTCFRGKSPKYTEISPKFILNQKCNRWNSIDFSFVKSVDEDWYNNIDEDFFTKEGDILVNSTGEGTIGRATYITKNYEGLIYDSHMLLLRLNRSIYNPILFVDLFNSSYIQTQIDKIKSAQATKQTELGINNLLKIRIPILSNLQVQQTIITQIDTYKNEIKILRERATLLKQQAEQEFEQTIFS